MLNAINQYRVKYSKSPLYEINHLVSEYCRLHCWAMIRHGDLYHAPACYLDGWEEIVALCDVHPNWDIVESRLLYDCIDSSIEHKSLLLNARQIAYSIVVCQYKVYLTIRTKP